MANFIKLTRTPDKLPSHAGCAPTPAAIMIPVYLVAALVYDLVYWHRTAEFPYATLEQFTQFRASTPFQFRVLVPALVRALNAIHPLKLNVYYGAVTYAATVGTLMAFARYLSLFFQPRQTQWYALAILYPMVWNYCRLNIHYFPYDTPAIFFFTVGLVYLATRRWIAYYAVFLLGTFNKETTCFLTIAMLATQWRNMPARRLAAHVAAQAILWLSIKWFLKHALPPGTGPGVFENTFDQNVAFFTAFVTRPTRFHLWRILTFGGAWMLVPFGWSRQPPFAKRLWWMVIPLMAGMTVVGILSESRIYGEILPIVLVPALFGTETTLQRLGAPSPATHSPQDVPTR